ncbi:hypothetical protein AUP68_06232 [Ilyonectria robusta]
MDQTSTRKRLRGLDPETDPDLTPQARPYESAPSRSPSGVSSVSGSSASSYRSRSLSPLKKQIMGLRLDETGVEIRELKIEAAPNLKAGLLLSTLDEIGNGLEFLPDNWRGEILGSLMLQGLDPRPWRYSFKSSSEFETLPGRIPSPQEVALVYEWAQDCRQLGHEEAGWNTEEDRQSLQALKALCRRTSTLTVNHTNFEQLQSRPIVLSIETNGPAPALNTAEVQMGVWHAAQWGFLRSAVLSSLREPSDTAPTEEQEKRADEALSRLPLIPEVIVQGHRWLWCCRRAKAPRPFSGRNVSLAQTSPTSTKGSNCAVAGGCSISHPQRWIHPFHYRHCVCAPPSMTKQNILNDCAWHQH